MTDSPTLDQLERALRDSEARLGAVVANAPIVLFALDRNGVFTMSEGRGRDALGLAPGEGLGDSVFETFADYPEVCDNVRRALAGETFTSTVVVADVAYDTWYGPWRDENGAVQGVIGVATDVTERHRAEEALARTRARVKALVRNSDDIIAVVDPDGGLRYSSSSAWSVLGYDRTTMPSNVYDVVHPDDHDRAMRVALSTLAGAPEAVEVRMRHADGSWRWIEAVGTDLRDDPDIDGVLITARDVSVRHEAQAKDARFEALVAQLEDMIVIVDADGAVRYASPSARRLMGSEQGPFFHLLDPDDIGPALQVMSDLLNEPGSVRRFGCRVLLDGTWRDIDVVATNLLEDEVVGGIICNCRDVTDRKHVEEALARQAYEDDLTGLPNRVLFVDRLNVALARARRRHSGVAVLFLDLDRFKVINDSLGHEPGDRLLAAVARRLEGALRPEDTVARFGGDEFTVLCEDLTTAVEPIGIAERISRALSSPFLLDDREVFLTASIGIAVAPDQTATADALLRDADAAMYRAKERGRARVEVFDEATRERAMERMETEHDLHRAIDRDELCLRYQPIIDLDSGRVTGVEALIRWEHPRRGLVEPAGFVPLAEETGLIVPIGEWALTEACRQLGAWRRGGVLPARFSVSVNLSASQLGQPRLRQVLDQALQESGMDPSSLWLEITESAVMGDADAAIATLRDLKERGLCLSIDDFGTGYSSLSYLKRLPIDALKVDRSFVGGLGLDSEDHAIAEAVVTLAHTLGLGAVAEGVETSGQLHELRTLGCDSAQGFLFARPLPPAEVETLLQGRPSW